MDERAVEVVVDFGAGKEMFVAVNFPKEPAFCPHRVVVGS
jgi:hypothetical protein